MTPEAWTDDDGPRFEKLRHNRKFHGRGPKHNPYHGMIGATRVGINKVAELVDRDARRANKQAKRAKALQDDARAIAKRRAREAREQQQYG